MKYRKALVTITGTVFVPEHEIAEALGDRMDDVEKLAGDHPERIEIAFRDLANDKLRDMFPTDEPMKLSEIDIQDMLI